MEDFNTRIKRNPLSLFSPIAIFSMTTDRILLSVLPRTLNMGLFILHHPSDHSMLSDALKKNQMGVAIISEMNKYFKNEVSTQGMTY